MKSMFAIGFCFTALMGMFNSMYVDLFSALSLNHFVIHFQLFLRLIVL